MQILVILGYAHKYQLHSSAILLHTTIFNRSSFLSLSFERKKTTEQSFFFYSSFDFKTCLHLCWLLVFKLQGLWKKLVLCPSYLGATTATYIRRGLLCSQCKQYKHGGENQIYNVALWYTAAWADFMARIYPIACPSKYQILLRSTSHSYQIFICCH